MIFDNRLLVVIALFLACTTAATAAEPTVFYLHGRSIFRSEPGAPNGTPFLRLTYADNVSFFGLIWAAHN